jgi:hypothetical protein
VAEELARQAVKTEVTVGNGRLGQRVGEEGVDNYSKPACPSGAVLALHLAHCFKRQSGMSSNIPAPKTSVGTTPPLLRKATPPFFLEFLWARPRNA